jgi:hypothetical protein
MTTQPTPSSSTSMAQKYPTPTPIVVPAKKLQTGFIEVCDAKVARLKGASGDVVLGDTIPLVATVSFRYNPPNGTPLPDVQSNVTLFQIDESGEVLSLPSNVVFEDVSQWLNENYSFNFTIKTSTGRPLHASPDSILRKTSVPWMRVLETSGLQSELVELDVRVEPASSVRIDVVKPKDVLERVAESQSRLEAALANLPQELSAALLVVLGNWEGAPPPAVASAVGKIQAWINATILPPLETYITNAIAAAAPKPSEDGPDSVPARTADAVVQQVAPKIDATNAQLQELLAVAHEFEWASIRELLESVRHELTHKKRGGS